MLHRHLGACILVVVRLVAHRNLLLLDLPPEFSIHLLPRRDGRRHGVVLEDPAHMVEQICDGKEHIGPVAVVEVIQEKFRILVFLGCRLPEPAVRLLPVLCHFFPHQIQLTQRVLRVLVALFGTLGQILQRLSHILLHLLSLEIELAKLVCRLRITLRRRFLIPGHRFVDSLLTLQQLAQRVLGEVVTSFSAMLKPQLSFFVIWQDATPIPPALALSLIHI